MTISFNRNMRALSIAAVGACALITISCSNAEPKGQVVVTVNGVEITVAELNEEARSRGLSIANDPQLRDNVIKDLIDRKLLAQEARAKKLDRSPQHLLATRRMEEVMLAQQLVAGLPNQPNGSDESRAAALIRSHPEAFRQRTQIWVDQVTLDPVADASLSRAIAAAPTMEDLEAVLAKSGKKWRRGVELWDSASMAPDVTQKLLSAGQDEMLVFPQANRLVAGRVVSVVPTPVAENDQMQAARAMVRRQGFDDAYNALLKKAQSAAEIRYQSGFAPRADSKD